MRKFLHVGCGQANKADTTKGFNTDAWQEVRFDIDPALDILYGHRPSLARGKHHMAHKCGFTYPP